MKEDLEKLKAYILSYRDEFKNSDDETMGMIESDIACKVFSFLAKYELKAGDWDFKQFMIDDENELTDGTIAMKYGNLDFDVTDRKVECDPAVAEIIEFWTKTFWDYDEDQE